MPALSTIRTSLHGFFHWVTSGAAAVDQFAVNRRVLLHLPSGAATATASVAEFPVYLDSRVPNGATVTAVKYVPAGTLTAHDTNYITLTLKHRTAAGASATTVATVNTKITGGTGNWSAFSPVAVTVDTANATIPANGMLTATVAKVAAGVDLPAGTLVVEYQEL